MSDSGKARAVGINHVALEVGDIDEALAFYGSFLTFKLRSKSANMAFIDLGDQFIALARVDETSHDKHRHFGLVVDDKEAVRKVIEERGIEIVSDRFLDFHDPWGNRIEIVGYQGIQFTKAANVLRGMGFDQLEKSDDAIRQLSEKGMAPGRSNVETSETGFPSDIARI